MKNLKSSQMLFTVGSTMFVGLAIILIIKTIIGLNSIVFDIAIIIAALIALMVMLTGSFYFLTSGGDTGESTSELFNNLMSNEKSTNNPASQHPPRFAAYLLRFLPKDQREALLGDLAEEYLEIYDEYGKGPAQFWYWEQVLTSFWPLLWRALQTLTKWGVIAWLGDVVRRLIP